MSRSRKAAAAGLTAAAVVSALGLFAPSVAAGDRDLRGAVTIAPGREGIVRVAASGGPSLGAGARLTLTAPDGARVTGTPLDARGYRGSVAADGRRGTYTLTSAGQSWRDGTFPFVLAVPADAVPGTRLRGCALRLTGADGVLKGTGSCDVRVGLPGPTLTRPVSGVPLAGRPQITGAAHPGAQVTVRDKDEHTVCTATADAHGAWRCTPGPAVLPTGPNRLQAIATLNGVSAPSEQIQVTVAGGGAGQ